MIGLMSISNAANPSCADLIRDFDIKIKNANLDKATTNYAAALRKASGDALMANKEEDCLKSINYAFKVAGLKPGGIPVAIPKEDKKEKISTIKATCSGFGYKEGTEKYADCMKDLYIK